MSLAVFRARAQLLAGARAGSVEEAVRHLVAVPAQDLRSARWALRARVPDSLAADVERGLGERRSLVVGWLGRGTLHLVCREDYAWLLALTAPARMRSNARRLAQEGIEPAQTELGLKVVARALSGEGPLTRAELGDRLAAAGVPAGGQALPHLLMLAALRGVVVLGPMRDGAQAFALASDWLGDDAPGPEPGALPDLALALGELARRYLAAHGPADAADLAGWAGLPVRAGRAGMRAAADALADAGEGRVELRRRPAAASGRAWPRPRLLPSHDPYLLGWRDRSFAVPAEHLKRVHPGGGIVRAVMLVDAQAAGTWSARRRGDRLSVSLEPFDALDARDERALRSEASDVARFEALELA